MRIARVADGPVFRKLAEIRSGRTWIEDRVQPRAMSAQGVAVVIKARARAVGLAPALFAGHSLRSGFLTEAARQPGANIFKMREVSRHKSIEILADYVRNHDLFRDHAGDGFL